MLSRLANYLLGGTGDENGTCTEETALEPYCHRDRELQQQQQQQQPQHQIEPRRPRLRQVTVECDEWVLVDPNSMDESWYVTPPACFTQPGPVHVETSPLEDLLIEHPSMSVYRSAGQDSQCGELAGTTAKTTTTTKTLVVFGKRTVNAMKKPHQQQRQRHPLAIRRNDNNNGLVVVNNGPRCSPHHHQHQHQHQQQLMGNKRGPSAINAEPHQGKTAGRDIKRQVVVVAAAAGAQPHQQEVQTAPRRPSARELRSNPRGDENLRIVQIRSAQKIMEKRSSSASKRNLLERSNKVREMSNGKGKRPRRQDRLRLNNSNVNNNRKC